MGPDGRQTGEQARAGKPRRRIGDYAGSLNGSGRLTPIPFRGLFKSTNGGANWFAINNGLANITTITSIVIDRDNTNVLYIGSDGGVFKSVDGGTSWSAFNDGLTNLEVFNLALAPGHPNTLYAGTRIGVFKVTDNTPGPNPIDDAQFFVRQHYLDFLNREPDQGGWDYWTNQITQCATDLLCVHHRRIGVSGAFFVELEFQRTGYIVYRMHRAAFGTWPNTATRANLTATQFFADRQLLPEGADVAQSTANFANSFVQRPAFLQVFQTSLTNAEFVNKLFDMAELVPYINERQQQIDNMNHAGKTRAQVLLDVIEISEFKLRENNRAFVLMQYFGYLRRDPDQNGYDFWLNILNNREPNNYRGMICSFLTSEEYQRRFGSVVTRSNADCAY